MEPEEVLQSVWAKSGTSGGEGEALTLHTCRVVDAFTQLTRRYPTLPQTVEQPWLWHRAFWACWLHDFGKAARSFQECLRPGGKRWNHRHEVLSLAFLPCFSKPESEDFPWIAAAIASHHKDAPAILNTLYNQRLSPCDWGADQFVDELAEETWHALLEWTASMVPQKLVSLGLANSGVRTLPAAGETFPSSRDVPELLVDGLRAYWKLWKELRKLPADDVPNRAAIVLRGLVIHSDHLASAHVPGLDEASLPDRQTILATLKLSEEQLFSHQKLAGSHNGSVVFSAPTGSGKTEAALFWAREQQETGLVPHPVVFLLPFQASLNAMARRLEKVLQRDVALIHAKSLQAIYRALLDQGYASGEAEKLAREHDNFGRLNRPAIRVTTPYQLLKAAYRLKGYEALWTSLAGSLLVLDETHAYEPERLGLLLEFLAELTSKWNTRVCAMTATMPSWLKRLLSEGVRADQIPPDPGVFKRFARHRIEIVEGNLLAGSVLQLARDEFEEGRSVLLAANTVATAQRVYDALRRSLPEEGRLLLHSRFTVADRLSKEAKILDRLAPERACGPMIAVATQVIEVSLNLDFDTIISEPAPLEALVQRFGRVNRAREKGVVPVRVLTEGLHDGRIYDGELVARALSVLRDNAGSVLDEQKVSQWLDWVYKGELEDRWLSKIDQNRQEFRAGCLASLRAFESDDSLEEAFDRLFQGTEVLPSCKTSEYRQLKVNSALEAGQLLVPTSWQHLQRYPDNFFRDTELGVMVADLPYDAEYGLRLSG